MAFESKPQHLKGVENGRLAGCGERPNCVSSVAGDPQHYVSPIAYTDGGDAALLRMRGIIESLPGAKIVESSKGYLRAEFKSRMFGFVDDFECLVDEIDRRIHIRSASRVGHYDFGVNRKRVEEIRALFSRGNPGRGADSGGRRRG